MPRSTYQFQRSLQPVLVPLLVGARLDEELHLHLLELARAEDEVARGDLVAEGLADLRDAERRLLAGRGHHVVEVDEDALRGLRAQVVQALVALHRAEVGLHQAVEHPRLGEGALVAAVRAVDLGQVGRRPAVLVLERLLQVVGAEPLVAGLALGQRVDERVEVAGGGPHLPGQDHRGVKADDVVALLDHRSPPLAADVLLQLHAERAVVPGRPGAAVDLAGRVDEAPALGEADDGVDAVGGHGCSSGSPPAGCRRTAGADVLRALGQRTADARLGRTRLPGGGRRTGSRRPSCVTR